MSENSQGGNNAGIVGFDSFVQADSFLTDHDAQKYLANFYSLEPGSGRLTERMQRLRGDEDARKIYEGITLGLADEYQKLWQQRHVDPMTGLLNRDGWVFYAKSMMGQVEYHNNKLYPRQIAEGITKPKQLIGFGLDIDRFKIVNDTHGHDAGDRLIIEVGNRLRSAVRQEDVIGVHPSGDEFAVAIIAKQQKPSGRRGVEHLDPEDRAQAAVERIQQIMQEVLSPWKIRGLNVSVGFAIWDGQESVEEFSKRIDDGMYNAKQNNADRLFRSNPLPQQWVARFGMAVLKLAGNAGRDIRKSR